MRRMGWQQLPEDRQDRFIASHLNGDGKQDLAYRSFPNVNAGIKPVSYGAAAVTASRSDVIDRNRDTVCIVVGTGGARIPRRPGRSSSYRSP